MKSIINDNIFTTELDCNDAQSVLQLLYKFKDYINEKVKGQGTFLYYLNNFIQNISITNDPTPHLLPVYNDNGRLKSNLPSEPNDVVINETPSVVFAETERQKSKNLLGLKSNSDTTNGVTITVNGDDGTITINGTATNNVDLPIYYLKEFTFSGEYTFSITTISGARYLTNWEVFYILPYSKSFTLSDFKATTTFSEFSSDLGRLSYAPGTVFDNWVIKIQLEKGKVATDWQPYNGAIVHEKDIEDLSDCFIFNDSSSVATTLGNTENVRNILLVKEHTISVKGGKYLIEYNAPITVSNYTGDLLLYVDGVQVAYCYKGITDKQINLIGRYIGNLSRGNHTISLYIASSKINTVTVPSYSTFGMTIQKVGK